MKKEMLINCLQAEEIRIAILENGVLEELYVERASHESYVGNIYKGRVVNIEPSIQAAFIDFGVGRNGFLHVSDVEPAYYKDVEPPQRGRRGERDRGDRGDRGGRGRGQRNYDDYDQPKRRDERRPPPPVEMENAVSESPAESAPAPVQSYPQEPWDTPPDGPEIIVEQIVEEDEFTPGYTPEPSDEAEAAMEGEWPTPAESREAAFDESAPTEPAPADTAELDDDPPGDDPVESEAMPDEEKEEGDESKPRRKGGRPVKGKAPRGRKPRKRPAKDDAPPDEPKPRPMDTSEHRTTGDEPPLSPLEPRPASSDLSDDDLTFSKGPSPSEPTRFEPSRSMEPEEEIIVQEEVFEEPEDMSAELEPAIPKIDPEESVEELAEEEKAMEEAEFGEAPTVSDVGDEGRADAEFDAEFGDVGSFMPRGRGRGDRGRGDRRGGGRDQDRRGGGRDRGGPRGGPRGGRARGRTGSRGGGGGRPPFGRPKPNIEDVFKRGQEVLVQVIKEGIGTKGPTLSTYISIAGRYLVLMPGLNRIGVSRKIEDEETRRRLREIMNELKPPRGIGFIIRTAGQDRNREELQSDLAYLSRLWQVVVRRIKKQKSPCEIYKESDMVTRTIRDIFTGDIDTIWVDERGAYEAAKEFMEAVMPRYADRIKFYDGSAPMFHKYGIEDEIARIQQRKIPLPQGGSIVIDQAEALVAIDVNSGNFRADNKDAEETAYQMNLHAAKEIGRQLRLRDLGGVIVNDFIDMRDERHRRNVEKALRDAVRRDRARTKILRISQFGLIEMTRQRIRPSLKRSAFQDCGHCKGTGHVKTGESVSIEVMRMLQLAVNREHIARIEIRVHDDVAQYLHNKKRKEVVTLEDRGNKQVTIKSAGPAVSPEFLEFLCYDNNGNEIKFGVSDEPPRPPQRRGRH